MITNTYHPVNNRPGIAHMKSKKQPAIDRRIEKIGRLNDEYNRCVVAGDYWGLIAVSYEYDMLNHMHATAARIRAEAELYKKGEKNER